MDSTGKYVASAGDRQIRIFHYIAGKFIEIKKKRSAFELNYIRRIEKFD